MKLDTVNPDDAVRPASAYAQGALVSGATRWLHVSGQLGLAPDGALAGDSRAQMERCFENLRAVLEASGMGPGNLVKLTAFLTDAGDVAAYREVRDRALGGHVCASTLLVVAALAHPQWAVEVEAVAAD